MCRKHRSLPSTLEQASEEYQKIIRECAEESARYERNQWKIRESISRQRVEANGCIVTQLSPEEKQRFQQAVMPLYEKILCRVCGYY